jgi:hypothetical protein
LRSAMRASIEAAADLGDLLDREPVGHSVRVARRSHQLAERLGMGPRDTARVAEVARVHHVRRFERRPVAGGNGVGAGDPGVPPALPEPAIALSAYAEEIALLWHVPVPQEGAGVSGGLAGASIPIGARVIAVADAFDRLTAPKGDRPGLDPESALAVLRASSHAEWDPRVVDVMADIVHHETGIGGVAELS